MGEAESEGASGAATGATAARLRRRALAGVAALGLPLLLASLPVPADLAPHAWCFFALFVGVVLALILEPLPSAAVGLIGVTLAALLSPWVLFSPAELARPGFRAPDAAVTWALGGFANGTVWLVFTAFVFAIGYDKTGLGRRIALRLVQAMGHGSLRLGYAVMLADLALAPFTPSNTARSAGTIFPIIRAVPPLYGSLPNDRSARRLGSYVMWTAFASSCVTSSLFLTALSPNLLAVAMIAATLGIEIGWGDWFLAAAPFCVPLLALLPLLAHALVRPTVRRSPEVVRWATSELAAMGGLSWREALLGVLVGIAILSWIFAGAFVNATVAALLVLALMLATGLVSWADVVGSRDAWDTLTRLATLMTLADGLNRTGFVAWFAAGLAGWIGDVPPVWGVVGLVGTYFASHYMFATTTAHTTAMLPVMLATLAGMPALPQGPTAMLLALSAGLMGVITPYATGPAPVYAGCGYISTGAFWRLGAVFGLLYLGSLLALGAPLLLR
ncbi:MAG: DASS family sodium-coupled anion symporter [Alphaproteobacteria bacterium]|nr:DASS family sodium-coupled anion symporter [Alphaproteobacteria bacterium]